MASSDVTHSDDSKKPLRSDLQLRKLQMTDCLRGLNPRLAVGMILLEVSALASPGAQAEEPQTSTTATDSGSDAGAPQEVLVTARRQSESVLKVPESITVLDSAALS